MPTAREIVAHAQRWELLRKRRAQETDRSVFRVDDRYVVKKFEIPLAARRYRRPWLIEDACLRRLDGDGAPRSFGWYEEIAGDHRIVWLAKEYLSGTPVETFAAADLSAAAALLARIHARGVATDDASAGNFLRLAGGGFAFLDFGRARLFAPDSFRLDGHRGRELAKFYREGLNRDRALWADFLPLYFAAANAAPARRARIRFACAATAGLRAVRKTLQGRSPRS